jgi:hypothetical protein
LTEHEHDRTADPFLQRLHWILDRLTADGDQQPRRTLCELADIGDRALQNWLAGDYPKGTRRLDSLGTLDRRCRSRWPAAYPPPDGTGPDLDELARAGWAARSASPLPAPGVVEDAGPERRRRTPLVAIGAGAAVVVAVVGAVLYAARPDPEPVLLTFDDLGGGFSTIIVYAGPEDSDAAREPTGRYRTGDQVQAECRSTGRPISSDPSVGEEDRTSDQWVRIDGTPGTVQWATVVYADLEAEVETLPEC